MRLQTAERPRTLPPLQEHSLLRSHSRDNAQIGRPTEGCAGGFQLSTFLLFQLGSYRCRQRFQSHQVCRLKFYIPNELLLGPHYFQFSKPLWLNVSVSTFDSALGKYYKGPIVFGWRVVVSMKYIAKRNILCIKSNFICFLRNDCAGNHLLNLCQWRFIIINLNLSDNNSLPVYLIMM